VKASRSRHYPWLLVLLAGIVLASVSQAQPIRSDDFQLPPLNLQHILSLVDSTSVKGTKVFFPYVYAEAPTYAPQGAPGEGDGCVDDAGRLLVVLAREYKLNPSPNLARVVKGLTGFLLQMNREDGLWYNFIFADGTINTTAPTSWAECGWWAARGMWGLAEVTRLVVEGDSELTLTSDIHGALMRSVAALARRLESAPLPPDQSAAFVIALAAIPLESAPSVDLLMGKLADRVLAAQFRQADHVLNGMFFCWKNQWHFWGNHQSLALVLAAERLKEPRYLAAVRLWATHFVPYLLQTNFCAEIEVFRDGTFRRRDFPQIAYGAACLVEGLAALAQVTGEEQFRVQAFRVWQWFQGRNAGGVPMYDPSTGRVWDGIDGRGQVNRNAGAESTIETLLALQAMYRLKKTRH